MPVSGRWARGIVWVLVNVFFKDRPAKRRTDPAILWRILAAFGKSPGE